MKLRQIPHTQRFCFVSGSTIHKNEFTGVITWTLLSTESGVIREIGKDIRLNEHVHLAPLIREEALQNKFEEKLKKYLEPRGLTLEEIDEENGHYKAAIATPTKE